MGRASAIAAVFLLGTAVMTESAMAQVSSLGVFCMTAVDVVPPPADLGNPILEVRVLEFTAVDLGTGIFGILGSVVGGTRGSR